MLIVDVKVDDHYGYCVVAALLIMGEESWIVVLMNLFEELS